MKSLNMKGPFPYTQEEIDKRVPAGVIGNYAFGYSTDGSDFYVQYVGRSDKDLLTRINHSLGEYTHFKFSVASTEKEAYEKECKNWHDFGGPEGKLDNDIHPDSPDYSGLECPYCD